MSTIESNEDDYDDGIEDIEMDKIIEKMCAHGWKITKAQLMLCKNEYSSQEQNQGFGMLM